MGSELKAQGGALEADAVDLFIVVYIYIKIVYRRSVWHLYVLF